MEPGETKLLVGVHSGRIVRFHVEQDLAEPTSAQVMQAGKRQRSAEAASLRCRIDADDVDLTDLFLTGLRRMHLFPVKSQQSVRALLEGQEDTRRIEPGFVASSGNVLAGPSALLRVPREGRIVHPQQFRVVLMPPVGAQGHTARHRHLG